MTGHPIDNGGASPSAGPDLPDSDSGPRSSSACEPSDRTWSAESRQEPALPSGQGPHNEQTKRSLHERYPLDPVLANEPDPAASCGAAVEPGLPEPVVDLKGWRKPRHQESLPEVHSSIKVPEAWHKKVLAFAGVGILVAVGYMDPVSLCFLLSC